ncbi:DUF4232 domain-containing protein [Pseudarthrobacter raffinosi]|uniref:DUF4232 domain-containing protein n=1 Tax=Pseudarthrobacter raffinosi TaxID=2953651 RepID=UPI00208FCBD1|nr:MULTISPECIES: DUF4232 domain-containing protein [unclassified Pseudarthrobacter]MCO4237474.1 DUF4232 domain-containing protein [Pseudarthrobacter sp. MDT3-28]MCO4252429.1 DUF4232 domain-containing protein [Pseudarthrobacter sp. MDT3-9]MCO4262785.1 DUF4232 domain-containing protein [Pseudarthrobacter sp. MDT3-26]
MTSQRIAQGFVITTAVAAAALMLTACGQSQPQAQGTTTPVTNSASPSSTPSSPGASASPSATNTQAGPALCKAATLSAATDASGGGAAGSVYMKLNLTNTGTAPCLLKGYPGVSLTANADGAPIGAAATRDESTPVADVLLAPGQTGTTVLRYTQAANYSDCTLTDAAGYRIYPPEDTASLFLPQPTSACTNANIALLSVGAFQPA